MNVVGVDPSISSTGVARIAPDGIQVIRVKSKPTSDDTSARLTRLRDQASRVALLVKGADLIVMEGPAFGKNNAMTHMLAGFWWLLAHGLEKTAPIAVVAPGTLKKFATGKGNASKDEVLAAAVRGFPDVNVTGNDEADALALAALGAVHLGVEFGGGFASSGRASVTAVHWPNLRGEN